MIETVRNRWKLILVVVLGVVLLGALAGVAYLSFPAGPDAEQLSTVEADERVVVEEYDGGYVVHDGDVTADTTGIVFYPGARVDPKSYVWTFAPLVVEHDVAVVIPEMPLNLAVLDADAAGDATTAYPDIDRWHVGGHSLGGAMACRYAAENPDRVDGLVLYAAYCDDGDDLRGTDTPVLSVQGTADGVIDGEAERSGRERLGESARVVEIDGMNHAQFGAYGDQRGDEDPRIDDETARDRLVAVTGEWLSERED